MGGPHDMDLGMIGHRTRAWNVGRFLKAHFFKCVFHRGDGPVHSEEGANLILVDQKRFHLGFFRVATRRRQSSRFEPFFEGIQPRIQFLHARSKAKAGMP